jgi:hypothetical protein
MASPQLKADLAIQFQAGSGSVSKTDARNKAQAALNEYNSLLGVLQSAGLLAAGKKGNANGEILILVSCPWNKLKVLVEHER